MTDPTPSTSSVSTPPEPGPTAHQPEPVVIVPPPRPDPLPQATVEFHQTLRTPRNRWWKGVLAILGFVAGYLALSVVLQGAAVAIDIARGRVDIDAAAAGRITLTPTLLVAVNLTNVLAIPLSGLLLWALWGQPIRWMHSVRGYVRWRLMGRAAVVIGPAWVLYVAALTLVGPSADRGRLTLESLVLLIIVVLTTPLQSAGEEYGARGLIARAAGSWVADRRVSLVVATALSSVVFMVAHGAGDPWLAAYYLCFGVALSLVVWRTGGLEVAVVIHAVNNVCAFGVSILLGQPLVIDRSAGTGGPYVLLPVLVLAAATAFVWWLTRRDGVDRWFRPVAAQEPARELTQS